MLSGNLSSRRIPAALSVLSLALLLLAVAGVADAKMLAANVPDFSFHQEKVVYTTPRLARALMEVTPENKILLVSKPEAGGARERRRLGNVLGKLNLGGKPGNSGHDEQYLRFGTLTNGDNASTLELVSGSLDAMQTNSEDGALSFLVSAVRVTGAEGTYFQSHGFCEPVAGADEQDWLRQCGQNSLKSIVKLMSVDGPQGINNAEAIPLPATAVLLLAGLLGLGRLASHRRPLPTPASAPDPA